MAKKSKSKNVLISKRVLRMIIQKESLGSKQRRNLRIKAGLTDIA